MTMPSINNAQQDISGLSRIYLAKSLKTSYKKLSEASIQTIHCPLLIHH